jgi:hypothetical protein
MIVEYKDLNFVESARMGVMEENIKYQSVDYKYPKRLWMVTVWLKTEEAELLPLILFMVKNSKKEAIEYGRAQIKEIRSNKESAEVIDFLILTPLTFSDIFSLKKEYWEAPYVPDSIVTKVVSFSKAIMHPNFYKVMITPTEYIEKPKEVFLTPAFVFTNEESKYLEESVKASHHPVSGQYKNTAIYNIGISLSYDLNKNKIFVSDKFLPN